MELNLWNKYTYCCSYRVFWISCVSIIIITGIHLLLNVKMQDGDQVLLFGQFRKLMFCFYTSYSPLNPPGLILWEKNYPVCNVGPPKSLWLTEAEASHGRWLYMTAFQTVRVLRLCVWTCSPTVRGKCRAIWQRQPAADKGKNALGLYLSNSR